MMKITFKVKTVKLKDAREKIRTDIYILLVFFMQIYIISWSNRKIGYTHNWVSEQLLISLQYFQISGDIPK